MTPKEAKAFIDRAFLIVSRHANLTTETQSLFERAHGLAVRTESETRRSAFHRGFGRYRASVETVARYFVCRWFAEPATVTNAREAAAVAGTCLYATALRMAVDEKGVLTPGEVNALMFVLEEVDYGEHLSNGPVRGTLPYDRARSVER